MNSIFLKAISMPYLLASRFGGPQHRRSMEHLRNAHVFK